MLVVACVAALAGRRNPGGHGCLADPRTGQQEGSHGKQRYSGGHAHDRGHL
jgi:hypothetical protein